MSIGAVFAADEQPCTPASGRARARSALAGAGLSAADDSGEFPDRRGVPRFDRRRVGCLLSLPMHGYSTPRSASRPSAIGVSIPHHPVAGIKGLSFPFSWAWRGVASRAARLAPAGDHCPQGGLSRSFFRDCWAPIVYWPNIEACMDPEKLKALNQPEARARPNARSGHFPRRRRDHRGALYFAGPIKGASGGSSRRFRQATPLPEHRDGREQCRPRQGRRLRPDRQWLHRQSRADRVKARASWEWSNGSAFTG